MQEVMLEGNALDVTVAAHDLAEGDVALRIPEHLVITLSRVFEDEVPLMPVKLVNTCSACPVDTAVLTGHAVRTPFICKHRVCRRWRSC